MSNRQISEVTSLLMVARNTISNEQNWARGWMAIEYQGRKAYCAQGALGYAWTKRTGKHFNDPENESFNKKFSVKNAYNDFIAITFWSQAHCEESTPIHKACELLVEHLPNYKQIKEAMAMFSCDCHWIGAIPLFNNSSNHKDVLEWFDRTIATSIKRDQEAFANV